jgi:hypothetical protein
MSTYKLAPNVRWVVDRFTVRLTDGRGAVRTLNYPEAAIWDLLSRGYPFVKVVPMTAHIAGLDPSSADALVRRSIEDWAEGGFVEAGSD